MTPEEYKAELKKGRQRRRQNENILQQQCKNRLDSLQGWKQLKQDVLMVHIPNERIFGGSIVTLLKSKGCPLSPMQIKLMNNYLAGFAANIKKGGGAASISDNFYITKCNTCQKGRVFAAESKAGTSLSKEQKESEKMLQDLGVPTYRINCVDDHDRMIHEEIGIKCEIF